MLNLHFCDANSEGRIEALNEGRTTVGRGPGNVLRIADNSVSWVHSELFVQGADVIVRDLGSRNGTRVGDQALYQRQCGAAVGAVIRFGSVRARLEFNPLVRTEATLDAAMEDITAFHHFSEFMRRSLAVKSIRPARCETERPEASPAAPCELWSDHGQTLLLPRLATATSLENPVVATKELIADATRKRDSGHRPARWIHWLSTSCLVLARQLLATF